MEPKDIHRLQDEVQKFLSLIQPHVEEVCNTTWKPSEGFLRIVLIAILRRQFEGLQLISQSISYENDSVVGQLLRPACEELLWCKYLVSIDRGLAKQILELSGKDEIYKALRAQDKYAGRTVTEELGLLPYLEKTRVERKMTLAGLRKLGKDLGWPESTIEEAQLPPISWIAKVTHEEVTYNSVYHATSRFVHFSVHELLRRVWDNPDGNVSVSSAHNSVYWDHFCLFWGLMLFFRTLEAIEEEIEFMGSMNKDTFNKATEVVKRIGPYGQAPFITAQELAWPE